MSHTIFKTVFTLFSMHNALPYSVEGGSVSHSASSGTLPSPGSPGEAGSPPSVLRHSYGQTQILRRQPLA